MSDNTQGHQHFKARLLIFFIMLILGFAGLFMINLHSKAFLFYSQVMAIVYALLCIGLHAYIERFSFAGIMATLWHQLLHWIGLLILIYLMSFLVGAGALKTSQAGFINLLLLAFSVFVAGVYTDPVFMLIGIMLAVFAAGSAMVQAHLWLIMIPLLIVIAVIIYLILYIQRKRSA